MGHRVIAEVAYHYMHKNVIRQVDRQLGKHGMVYWSTWPDEIRSDVHLLPTTSDWHYQDMNSGLNANQIAALRADYPKQGGQLWVAYDRITEALQSSDTVVTVLGETLSRRQALVYLIHLTGDCYCPMHIARMNDKGGNSVNMHWHKEKTNLHKVWDEYLIDAQGYSYSEMAQMLINRYGQDKTMLAHMTDMQIAQDVYAVTGRIYDYQAQGDKDTYHYIWNWREDCNRLLFLSGIHLAQLLNQLYL